MGSSSEEPCILEEIEIKTEDHSPAERAQWMLNPPEPPSLWCELVGSIKQTVYPNGTKSFSSVNKICVLKHVVSILRGLFPILHWGQSYKLTKFKRDLMAGLTLASLSIPQSIGYANLAKLDPQYGLYTNVVPPLIYAAMGSSREIAIGPVAVVSLLLSSMIQKIVDPVADPISYRKFVFTVTFFAGTFQAGFGLLRLGFLVDFLSHAAIVGFMGGAAIVIGMQQLKGLLGITHFTNNTDVVSVMAAVWRSIQHPWNPRNFLLGCSFLIFILFARFVGRRNKKLFWLPAIAPLISVILSTLWNPRNFLLGCSFLIFILFARFVGRRNKKFFWLPAIAPLISVILSTLVVFLTRADKHGVNIVKHIVGGLNPISAKELQFSGHHLGEAAKIGLISAIIALTEAIAVGRSFATIKGYHLDGNKEMVALGFMNITGSLTSCYVATGSFSRTAVNFSAGCETAISNVVMAITVLLSLEFMTRLLYFTPTAILASIILSALPGLIDINEAYNIWKVDKFDFLACVGAFIGVLFASVEIGLLTAVIISFARILLNSIRPGIRVLGRIPGTDVFCCTNQNPISVKTPGVLVIRIDSTLLCFANANFIRERIMRWLKEEEEESMENKKHPMLELLVLDMSSLTNIDTSGIHALEELHRKLVSLGVKIAIANPRWQVIHKFKLAKFVDRIGGGCIFLTVGEAVDAWVGSNDMVKSPI